jgi:hypothetical protein
LKLSWLRIAGDGYLEAKEFFGRKAVRGRGGCVATCDWQGPKAAAGHLRAVVLS